MLLSQGRPLDVWNWGLQAPLSSLLWCLVVTRRPSQGAVARQDMEDTWDLSCVGHETPWQQPIFITCVGQGRCWSQGLWVTSVKASRPAEFSPGCSESVTKGASLGWGAK